MLTAFGIMIASPWICTVALIMFATSFFFSAKDDEGRSLLGLALPLVMLLNLPLGYDQLLTIRLQQVTTGLASVMLDVLVIPHAVTNNVIQLTTRELFVAEACSGIQSVFTLMFLATLLIAIYRRPVWLAPIYLAIAALLAVAANVMRVTVVAIGDVWFSIDLAEGWQHELVGYTALCIATLFLLSFDHLVTTLLHPVDPIVDGENNVLITLWNFVVGFEQHNRPSYDRQAALASDEAVGRGVSLWDALWPRRIVVGFLLVLGLAGIAQAINLQRPVPIFVSPTEVVFQPQADVFERPFSALQVHSHEQARGGANPRLGENADIWNCLPTQTEGEIQVVLSQPYAGWHELCICYEINAWILLNREIRGSSDQESQEDGTGTIPYAFARFKNADGRFAYLIYSAIDAEGNIIEPPPRPGRLGNRFTEYFGDTQQATNSNVMMMQMFIAANEKISPDSLRELASDFVEMRSIIQRDVKESDGGEAPVSSKKALELSQNSNRLEN